MLPPSAPITQYNEQLLDIKPIDSFLRMPSEVLRAALAQRMKIDGTSDADGFHVESLVSWRDRAVRRLGSIVGEPDPTKLDNDPLLRAAVVSMFEQFLIRNNTTLSMREDIEGRLRVIGNVSASELPGA